MLAHHARPPANVLWRERRQPRVSPPARPLQALAHRSQKAFLLVVAAVLAVSIDIFMRVVLTAHRVPRWQEDLAQFLPFLD
jgi:hypothetical protein